ncbi:hypothetical protein H9651_03575 [Microbacterium sp. Sa4CUA7]|uniref:Fluoride ion transporter CrcB n=1 Tax=Microbacterium pullorum TaxID=2762236 RepID=A0ABR8RZN8_9MICO|nr:hypothetical protein [Microbacterium pullorum]MBD7956709.1 hypothetical protein [Microbacterium pullorum]
MANGKRDPSLWITLAVCIAFITAGGFLLEIPLRQVKAADLSAGLTNVATIGGIVSGLSLSGTAVLTLSGRYTLRILERFGSAIRFVLFGGFSVLVSASLACAVSVMWVGEDWVRFVLAFTIPVMLVTLIATALLINSAFAWESPSGQDEEGEAPYRADI